MSDIPRSLTFPLREFARMQDIEYSYWSHRLAADYLEHRRLWRAVPPLLCLALAAIGEGEASDFFFILVFPAWWAGAVLAELSLDYRLRRRWILVPSGRRSIFSYQAPWTYALTLAAALFAIPEFPSPTLAVAGIWAFGVWFVANRRQIGGEDRAMAEVDEAMRARSIHALTGGAFLMFAMIAASDVEFGLSLVVVVPVALWIGTRPWKVVIADEARQEA
ncbi:hypothetical protein [Salininema proteolyticum]|uniref:Uncharacterized protein n=1 Tax=Salininema proteolyticum TaxID=1607685 RepID=A0ABV8U021_9ACTN